MSGRACDASSVWRERLAKGGLTQVFDLLDDLPKTSDLELLDKAGLGGRRRWRWTLGNDQAPRVVYVKQYTAPRWREQWDRLLRQSPMHSRAYWEYAQSRRLGEAHIPAPKPVAFAEEMRGPLERRSAVVLESVAGDGFDRQWASACASGAAVTCGRARHDMAVRLGRFVAAFHSTGLCHRDLYLCHIFVDLDLHGRQPPKFALIDLARMHKPRWRRMRWVIKDLAQADASARQIGVSCADRLRFLRAYLGLSRGAPRVRWYVRRIKRKSDWILRRIERKNRR